MDHRRVDDFGDRGTKTSSFGVGRRESHDASAFYQRFSPPALSDDETVNRPPELLAELGRGRVYAGPIDELGVLPDRSVALVVTSPPYFVGKDYEVAVTGELDSTDRLPRTYFEYLDMLRRVLAECARVLEPGGRMAINVANLGRKPYRSLSADVIGILQDELGLLLRGEVIWEKSTTASGSCAWGSFARASNPVLRDMTERVVIASKGRFSRAPSPQVRRRQGLPHRSTLTNDEFLDVTRDVWRIDAESATRVGHPAPFPIDLPRRLIDLYTYEGDLVVDPFVGSGTTLVAAARTGRIGVGFDTEDDYVRLAQDRLDDELARVDRLAPPGAAADADAATDPDPVDDGEPTGWDPTELSFEDRRERFQALALAERKKATDIARRRLEEAGFTDIADKARHPSGLVEFTFRATDGAGVQWWVEVGGAFTTNRPGLQRVDTVWKLLGRVHVLRSVADNERVLVLTPGLPKPNSPGDKALRAAGPSALFDLVELYDPAGLARLGRYGAGTEQDPLIGYWDETGNR